VSAEPEGVSVYSGESIDCAVCYFSAGNFIAGTPPVSGSQYYIGVGNTNFAYSLSMTTDANEAVFNLKTASGTVVAGTGSQVELSELTHTAPQSRSGDSVSWSFDRNAPGSEGAVTFPALRTGGSQ